jgi:hypothetical protein
MSKKKVRIKFKIKRADTSKHSLWGEKGRFPGSAGARFFNRKSAGTN